MLEIERERLLDKLLLDIKAGLLNGKEYEIKQSKDGFTVYEVRRKRIK